MSELRPNTRAGGFTLVELMITIVVAAVLVGLALPSFRDAIVSNKVTESTNQLILDLNYARAEAVRRGTLVAVISDSGSNDWSAGWKIEADTGFANDGTTFASVLRNTSGVDTASGYSIGSKVTASATGTGITPSNDKVIFTSQGNMIPKATSFDLDVCRPDSKPTQSKRITIVTSGMITTKIDTTGSPAPSC